MTELPRVLMIFTGGTISMRIVPGRGAVPVRDAKDLLGTVPQLEALARVDGEDFDRLPGPHWTPERMMELSRLLDERLAGGGYAGAVVTHGTDTIEETAYCLDLVLATDRPVVLTGAMKTGDDPVFDGPANLIDAVRCVASPAAHGLGVVVVMDEIVHPAREVVKSHTESLNAFTSGAGGHVGEIDFDGLHLHAAACRRERIPARRIEPRVELVAAAVGCDDRLLMHALDTGARGIVLDAMGRGNVPPPLLRGVRRAAASGIPVVVTSRCRNGRTAPRYGYEGGGVTLREAGAVFGGDLPASKARIKLMVLLGAGYSPNAIRESFERPGW